ncbi:ZKSCAN7 [Cordylochernes scorpioides]|uniref:ZKSCAN7 n=1 Tax=Cordylochernes scorpioides TaxID=51811 RepID=A0ABY6K9R0_9ARAC|nr:ZKSCAN7 [Cordylochernes scorpioides]
MKQAKITKLSKVCNRLNLKNVLCLQERNLPGKSVAKDVFKNGQMFKECQYCKNLFKSKEELWEHYRADHSDVRPLSCQTCLYTTANKYHLEVHINIHAVDRTHKCDICKASFKTKLSLDRHKRDNHLKVNFHKCKHCNFTTKWSKSLKSHEELHAKGKNFKCSRCDFVTIGKSNLKLHEYKHDNKNYLTCMFCNYTTLKSSHLETHTLTHTGERPFKCEICFFRTPTKKDLIHMCEFILEKSHLNVHNVPSASAVKTIFNVMPKNTKRSQNIRRKVTTTRMYQ